MGKLASDAAILSVTTVFVYFCAYSFEVGHAFRFGYPPEIIGPTLYSLEGPWTIGIFGYIFFFLQLNFTYWPHTGKWFVLFLILLIAFVILILTVPAFFPNWPYVVTIFIVGCSLVGSLAWKIFWSREMENARVPDDTHPSPHLRNIFTVYDFRSKLLPGTIAYNIVSKLGFDPLAVALLALIIVPFLFSYAGLVQSIAQKDFYTIALPGEKPELVVRMVGGNVISVPFNPQTSETDQVYRVRQISALGKEVFGRIRIDTQVHFFSRRP